MDAELTLLPGERPLRDQARVRVHVASGEYLARVRVLDGAGVAPGASAPVQLRLERPVVAGRGDRLIVRSYSPAVTIGGALVVDPWPPRSAAGMRRRAAARPSLGGAEPVRAAMLLVEEAGTAGIDAPRLAARVTEPLETLMAKLAAEPSVVALGKGPAWLLSRSAMEALAQSARDVLSPLSRGAAAEGGDAARGAAPQGFRGGAGRSVRPRDGGDGAKPASCGSFPMGWPWRGTPCA